ncbi:hypothetical protein EDC01DRAFT_14406 [Geopyxis carbonaria]|nr:hypothetical protein EDC01DRAFT_14406 [Geopyxis carbonaria]
MPLRIDTHTLTHAPYSTREECSHHVDCLMDYPSAFPLECFGPVGMFGIYLLSALRRGVNIAKISRLSKEWIHDHGTRYCTWQLSCPIVPYFGWWGGGGGAKDMFLLRSCEDDPSRPTPTVRVGCSGPAKKWRILAESPFLAPPSSVVRGQEKEHALLRALSPPFPSSLGSFGPSQLHAILQYRRGRQPPVKRAGLVKEKKNCRSARSAQQRAIFD